MQNDITYYYCKPTGNIMRKHQNCWLISQEKQEVQNEKAPELLINITKNRKSRMTDSPTFGPAGGGLFWACARPPPPAGPATLYMYLGGRASSSPGTVGGRRGHRPPPNGPRGGRPLARLTGLGRLVSGQPGHPMDYHHVVQHLVSEGPHGWRTAPDDTKLFDIFTRRHWAKEKIVASASTGNWVQYRQ